MNMGIQGEYRGLRVYMGEHRKTGVSLSDLVAQSAE